MSQDLAIFFLRRGEVSRFILALFGPPISFISLSRKRFAGRRD